MIRRPLFAVLACTSLLLACGPLAARAQAQPPEGGLPYVTSFDVKADAALAARVPESVRAAGAITVATNPNTPPTIFVGDDNRTLQGREVDIMTAIIRRLGLQPRWINSGGFGNIVPGLASGRFDAALANLSVMPSRLKTVDFVSYFNSNRLGLVRAWTQEGTPPAPATDLAGLCGETIGAGSGTTNADVLNDAGPVCAAAGRKPIEVPLFPSRPAGVSAVISGRLPGFFGPYEGLLETVKSSRGRLYLAGVYTIPDQFVGIGLHKDSPLTPLVAQALNSLIQDGTYAAILNKWDIAYGSVAEAKTNWAILGEEPPAEPSPAAPAKG